MAATGTASIAISLSTALAATLMPTLVSQRRFFDAVSLRFGHNSSISAISRKTPRNTANRITLSRCERQAKHAKNDQHERGDLEQSERLAEIGGADQGGKRGADARPDGVSG